MAQTGRKRGWFDRSVFCTEGTQGQGGQLDPDGTRKRLVHSAALVWTVGALVSQAMAAWRNRIG